MHTVFKFNRAFITYTFKYNLAEGLDFKKPIQVLLTVRSYHVTYAFQSESTLYSCLNFKELLARSRREI